MRAHTPGVRLRKPTYVPELKYPWNYSLTIPEALGLVTRCVLYLSARSQWAYCVGDVPAVKYISLIRLFVFCDLSHVGLEHTSSTISVTYETYHIVPPHE